MPELRVRCRIVIKEGDAEMKCRTCKKHKECPVYLRQGDTPGCQDYERDPSFD